MHADAVGFDNAMLCVAHCHHEQILAISLLGTGFDRRRATQMSGEEGAIRPPVSTHLPHCSRLSSP
jgi:hypothetical protein